MLGPWPSLGPASLGVSAVHTGTGSPSRLARDSQTLHSFLFRDSTASADQTAPWILKSHRLDTCPCGVSTRVLGVLRLPCSCSVCPAMWMKVMGLPPAALLAMRKPKHGRGRCDAPVADVLLAAGGEGGHGRATGNGPPFLVHGAPVGAAETPEGRAETQRPGDPCGRTAGASLYSLAPPRCCSAGRGARDVHRR